jgi:hypothetical protein
MELVYRVNRVRERMSECRRCATGISNNPAMGQIPRGAYIDDPIRGVDVVVVGLNPGPVGSGGGKPYEIPETIMKTVIDDLPAKIASHGGKLVSEWLKLVELASAPSKEPGVFRFDEVKFYAQSYLGEEVNVKEEKYLAPQIVFYLTEKVNDYFRKLRELVKLLGFSETPNIYWTNLVKCEGREPSNQTKDICYGRFLEEELRDQALKEKWIIAVSGDVYEYLSKKYGDRVVVGTIHPTGKYLRYDREKFDRLLAHLRDSRVAAEIRRKIEMRKRCWLTDKMFRGAKTCSEGTSKLS